MKPRFFLALSCVWAVGWLSLVPAGNTTPVHVPVVFNFTTNTIAGQSVFVVGNIPQLGNWDVTRAVKLVATNCVSQTCDWTVAVGIPEGVAYEYKFVLRDDCTACYADANNALWEAGPNRVGSTTAGPPAPFTSKTVFYLSSWSSVSILYSNTATASFSVRPMNPHGAGRTAGETLWRVDGLNQPGETNLVFVFTDNNGAFDNPDGVGGKNYETPLDACLVQDGQIYNYWPAANVSTNRVETFFQTTNAGVSDRTIRVYLPRGYDQHTTKRYPVLYMHDGQNLFLNMGSFGSWNADTNANNLIRYGKMREVIIVGVDNTSERLREYTPPGCNPPLGGSSLGAAYTDFLLNDVKPAIDSNYRTLTNAASTGVLGSSMGGLISTYLGWEQANTFGKIGAMSSSYQVCLPIVAPDTKRNIRLYVDSGDQSDGLGNTITERDNILLIGYTLNIDFDHTIGFGHDHNEFWWDRRLPRCLTFLFPPSDEPNSVLDTVANPPRTTIYAAEPNPGQITWTAFQQRRYTLQGSTNELFASGMTWSNLVTTATAEDRPWDYHSLTTSNTFHFLRIRQEPVFGWRD